MHAALVRRHKENRLPVTEFREALQQHVMQLLGRGLGFNATLVAVETHARTSTLLTREPGKCKMTRIAIQVKKWMIEESVWVEGRARYGVHAAQGAGRVGASRTSNSDAVTDQELGRHAVFDIVAGRSGGRPMRIQVGCHQRRNYAGLRE